MHKRGELISTPTPTVALNVAAIVQAPAKAETPLTVSR
jgi:hypothetical protein